MVATSFSQRPSDLVGIEDEWAAYCFDSAIALFGNWVEGKLMERDKAGKPKYTLEGLLSGDLTKGRFASAASLIAAAGRQ